MVLKHNKSEIFYVIMISFFRFSSPQIEIRALVEGQMLHHKAIALDMGFNFGNTQKIMTK